MHLTFLYKHRDPESEVLIASLPRPINLHLTTVHYPNFDLHHLVPRQPSPLHTFPLSLPEQ